MKKYLIKFHQFLFKKYYKNISNEFREFTLLESVRLRFENNEQEISKIKKDSEKFNNFLLKENSDLKEKNNKLITRIEQIENDFRQVIIQINRLKNLKR
jgi:hypothetical protein